MHANAILCDLDGTLLDTVADIAFAVNTTLRDLGRATISTAAVTAYVGQGVDVLLHRALSGDREGRVHADLLQRARARFDPVYIAVNGQNARIYPGVEEGLSRFAALGLRLGCVTNKPQRAAEVILVQFDLARHFDCVVGGDALPQRKPAPQPFWHAADRLGVPRADCLVLGDSANDANGARAAGMRVALVDYGYSEGRPISEIDCDAVFSSFVELADMLEAHDCTEPR
ncbi:MAG: phosphoglycolate phosphatase [Dokdonella sp.]